MPPVLTADPRPTSHGVGNGRPTSGVQFRRAVTLMLMTLVLPGSAQLAAGRKDVGRIAMRIWFSVLLVSAMIFVLGLLSHSFGLWFFLSPFRLGVIRFVLIGLAVGWAYLFVDAWRIGEPLALQQRQRLAMVGINGVLCFSVAGSLLFASHLVNVNKDLITAVFSNGKASAAT